MQSGSIIKKCTKITSWMGLIVAGVLSACGGSHDTSSSGGGDGGNNPPPPAQTTVFGRIGADVQLYSGAASNVRAFLLPASVDASANITLVNAEPLANNGSPAFSYNFYFGSGLPGGSVGGGQELNWTIGAEKKQIDILMPTTTQVQNALWRDTQDPTLFGLGAIGNVLSISSENWPTTGSATYTGHAYQYIVDSNPNAPDTTTYARFVSDISAVVDYVAKTISVTIAPNATLKDSANNPLVANALANFFAANYVIANLDLSGTASAQQVTNTQQLSGFGLPILENAFAFFGPNAENVGGFIRYSGSTLDLPAPGIRDQFVSFTMVKQ